MMMMMIIIIALIVVTIIIKIRPGCGLITSGTRLTRKMFDQCVAYVVKGRKMSAIYNKQQCNYLAQKQYKYWRHDQVAKVVLW